jgi:hypothetical protein
MDYHDVRRNDWANVQADIEIQILLIPGLHNEMAIDTCVENFYGAALMALATATYKRRPRDHPYAPVTVGI